MPTIRLENVAKIYKNRNRETTAIMDINLQIGQGEFLFFVGSRGAGKSTLLDVICGAVKPDRGAVYVDDADLNQGTRREQDRRRACFGRIGQESELNRTMTVYENMGMSARKPLLFRKRAEEAALRVEKALGLVGMGGTGDRYPRDMTPSECRRVQMAKAILRSPSVLLLDNFTDQMDEDTVWDMLHLLNALNKRGTTVLMATNSSYIVNVQRKRVVTLADGKIAGDVKKGRYGFIG
ncbi:MAG: ATP-binding cassette domain-containing protein [Oscillibacter sp.]|nr:ATP-binding cassette domain-containing protein [Oscillibacter sp.]